MSVGIALGWTVLVVATGVQLGYWLYFFARLARYQPVPPDPLAPTPPVSVVICARNESANLKKNLDRFLNQNYPSFEVIVVNDHSTDDTWEIGLEFSKKYPILSIINAPPHKVPGKKLALATGIKAARHELVLLSDADCHPLDPSWIRHMQASLNGPIEIGLGFSPYRIERGMLNLFIRFEAIYTAVQYFSFALAGLPYMGVGRNLIYAKSLFQRLDGFSSHLDIASGDDDLFINAAATAGNTAVVMHPESFVLSEPKRTWRGYYYQKSRHLTTSVRYHWHHQWLLGGLALSHYLHYAAAIALWAMGVSLRWILVCYLVRMWVVMAVFWFVLRKLRDPLLWKWIPILDAVFLLYYHVFAPIFIIGNNRTWKL